MSRNFYSTQQTRAMFRLVLPWINEFMLQFMALSCASHAASNKYKKAQLTNFKDIVIKRKSNSGRMVSSAPPKHDWSLPQRSGGLQVEDVSYLQHVFSKIQPTRTLTSLLPSSLCLHYRRRTSTLLPQMLHLYLASMKRSATWKA
jgi:hypothetical protein